MRLAKLKPPGEGMSPELGKEGMMLLLLPIVPMMLEKLDMIPCPLLLLKLERNEPMGPINGILR